MYIIKFLKLKTQQIIIATLISSLLFCSCQKLAYNEEDSAPELPPVSTFLMDFSQFPNDKFGSDSSNYMYAYANVMVWNVVVAVNMMIPAAAFTKSFNHKPVWSSEDKVWVWSYSFTAGLESYNAVLHGKVNYNTVLWKMYISKDGGYSDFLWFYGEDEMDKKKGTWTICRDPETNPNEYIGIEWNRYLTNTNSDIKYSIIDSAEPLYGSYIFFGHDNDPEYDAFYDIYNNLVDIMLNIKWNTANRNGRVKNEDHFVDDQWYCWDTNLANIDCN